MELLHERCAGLDVHKKTVVGCCVHTLGNGRVKQETRTFGTTTGELLTLLDWLNSWQCTHVAMESTGDYWKPIYNILEGQLEAWLVNARHIKAVPGRKTDVRDAEWVADLLRHGLMRPSFVPPREQRDLRDLTRQRSNLVGERASVVNRIQKVLEDANIKLSSFVSDVTGVSARAMIMELVSGSTDAAAMAELSYGRMRTKKAQIEQALVGRVRDHHRFILASHFAHVDFLDEQIEEFNRQIDEQLKHMSPQEPTDQSPQDSSAGPGGDEHPKKPAGYTFAKTLLEPIPGLGTRLVEIILAEIGTDMSRFPSHSHLAVWAGVAPGNNESAGKRLSGRARPGNQALRTALVQAAHAASHAKGTYFKAKFDRLVVRRGKKRAIVAVARALVIAIYHVLKRQKPFTDIGEDYLNENHKESKTNYLIKRLQSLGYDVTLTPKPLAAAA